ncbi:protein serine/threonine kinase, putative [Entamoeba dispar SAW760]|uniref:Protein serine/threonine kinase, putative n=1 Tax=Entamoeba dispar (strain ATCC PRA-260 / SAW760) TaxID=370354 RepID=B0EGJ7_ENTDS|nr:protein serine/threonine kinase, putative [Entamoeba dispar SAW760]EDR26344.1 protein serine/threonine kinase, putative [Entamoeba dispar SAW760]|eukprot:EDR26344.1 protein serine/threonine kinase, putative [Entamoeba dispar SAW760]
MLETFVQIILFITFINDVIASSIVEEQKKEGYPWCDIDKNMSWCDINDEGIIYLIEDTEKTCYYDEDKWRGWMSRCNESNGLWKYDEFVIQKDCCGKDYQEEPYNNELVIMDTVRNTNKVIKFSAETTAYSREYLNITIYETFKNVQLKFLLEYVLENSIISISRSIENSERNPKTSQPEYVLLKYNKIITPFVKLTGKANVIVEDNIIQENDPCEYRFTSSKDIELFNTINSNNKIERMCSFNEYKRMAVCGKNVEVISNCNCEYENHEYLNNMVDCSYFNEELVFFIHENQIETPFQTRWKSFTTNGKPTTFFIEKGRNITFIGDVYLPKTPVYFEYGKVIFEGTIYFSDEDGLCDLGEYNINNVNIDKVTNNRHILFVGKCGMGYENCQNFIKDNKFKEVKCGGSQSRILKESSKLKCECEQENEINYIQSDCELFSIHKEYSYDLFINYNYNGGNNIRYWNSIIVNNNSIVFNGSKTIVKEICDFTKVERLDLFGYLSCKELHLKSTTRIIGHENSELNTYSIFIDGKVNNLNKDALIQMGKGKFLSDGSTLFTFTEEVTECFELVSSLQELSNSINSDKINKEGEKYINVQVIDKIVRICPYEKIDKQVKCNVIENTLKIFNYEQCPCNGEYCFFYLDNLKYKELYLDETNKITGNIVLSNNFTINSIGGEAFIYNILFDDPYSNYFISINGNCMLSYTSPILQTFILNGKLTLYKTTYAHIISNTNRSSIVFQNEPSYLKLDASVSTSVEMINGIIQMGNGRLNDMNGIVISNSYKGCLIGYFEEHKFSCITCSDGPLTNNCSSSTNVLYCQSYNSFSQCIECVNGYFLNEGCLSCSANCKKCRDDNHCLQCEDGYTLSDDQCSKEIAQDCLLYYNNKCVKCAEGKYSIDGVSCTGDCQKNCVQCYKSDNDKSKCTICKDGFILFNNECLSTTDVSNSKKFNSIVGNTGVECESGYVLVDGSCQSCSSYHHDEDCNLCDLNQCLSCKTKLLLNGICTLSSDNCNSITNSKCFLCKEQYYKKENCQKCGQGCKVCDETGTCLECINESALLKGEVCEDKETTKTQSLTENEFDITFEECDIIRYGSCLRCKDGYYASNGICKKCDENCGSCVINSKYCMSCKGNAILSNHTCLNDYKSLSTSCELQIKNGLGCIICNDGYYKKDSICFSCEDPMETCITEDIATNCKKGYFLDNGKCINQNELKNCKIKTPLGCSQCEKGYYVDNLYCTKCEEHCKLCTNKYCDVCEENYISIDGTCYYFRAVNKCESSDGLKCTKCSSGYTPEGKYCAKKNLWYVWVIIVVGIIFIISLIILGIVYKRIHHKIKKTNFNVKSIDSICQTTDLVFCSPHILTDKPVIEFYGDDELKVKQTKEVTFYIANAGKSKIKIQPTIMENEKYEFIIEPEVVVLRSKEVVVFKAEITPLCSTQIDDKILFHSYDMKKDIMTEFSIGLEFITEQTNIIDYDELIFDKKLGEGGFGIVYKGIFRENEVAIKVLKDNEMTEGSMEEFKIEVDMLDKFRCEYIVQFYGACFIPTKTCMVTEYAKYGSLHKWIKNKKKVSHHLKIKFCLDAAKAIEYLHSNGILHRDIKPDNMLVFSFAEQVGVNLKLTDFGSARSINRLMTNMTFTKGIGTPVYMAPEVLQQKRYKTTADIYSFGISIYEILTWQEAYPTSDPRFVYPWKIAEFVISGKRLEKPTKLPENEYRIISDCWKDKSDDRIRACDAISRLERLITY